MAVQVRFTETLKVVLETRSEHSAFVKFIAAELRLLLTWNSEPVGKASHMALRRVVNVQLSNLEISKKTSDDELGGPGGWWITKLPAISKNTSVSTHPEIVVNSVSAMP